MRIISGSARGRTLVSPKHEGLRPTSDRVKESLFNILTVRLGSLSGVRVLDLFAGTGNLGIEALSRGAESAIFIDESRESVLLINKNLQLTGFMDRGTVIQKNVVAALKHLEDVVKFPFGLVFLDPPYRMNLASQVIECLSGSALLDTGNLIVAETSRREDLPQHIGRLEQIDRRVYGDTAISFFSLEPDGAP